MDIRQYNIDYDSPEEIKQLIQHLKARFGQLTGSSRKEKKRGIYDACCEILSFDTSILYSNFDNNERKFYVYAHLDESKPISAGANPTTTFAASNLRMTHFPFYIGKGTGQRAYVVNRNETHKKVKQKLSRLQKEPKVLIIKTGLTEAEALQLEDKLIDIFGLAIYGGYLTNLDQGVDPQTRMKLYEDQLRLIRGRAFHLYKEVDI